MTKLYITAAHVSAFEAAKRSVKPKRAGNSVFRQVKSDFGIPAHIKLGVDRDSDDDTRNALYVKGSRPRQFLTAGADGRYTTQVLNAPAPAAQTDIKANGRFVKLNGVKPLASWKVITRDNLLRAIRNANGLASPATVNLPADFPADAQGADGMIVDQDTGNLYFRA